MPSAPRRTPRTVNAAQFFTLLLTFGLLAGLSGVLAAGLVMPAVAAVGNTTETGVKIFDDLPTELSLEPPSEQSVMLAADGSLLATFYADNRIVVGLDQVAPIMREAVVAVEDKRFYEHGGIDPEGLVRAAVKTVIEDETQGGSTLTQQYVKNVLIEAGRVSGDQEAIDAATEVSLGRKLREAKLAVALEQQMTKDEILEGYLNIAQFGPSQYGVEAAARYYFNTTASELNIAEAAMLAGITQSPGRWDPVRNPENALIRRNTVLSLMREQGVITQEEYDVESAIPIADMLDIQPTTQGCSPAGISAYFCDFVVRTILNDPIYGETIDDRRRLLNRGGLTIATTIDPAKQALAYESIVGAVPINDGSGISGSVVTVEPGTGKVVAMAQNTNYANATPESPRDTLVNFNTDNAYGGSSGFQTGSSFKAFVLTEWLESGRSLSESVDATRRNFPRSSWNISCAPEYAADFNPKNAESFASGPMSVLNATRLSVNTAYAAMANQLDICAIADTAAAMGVHTAQGTELQVNPSMVLGSNTIAPLTMAAAFATYASGGTYCAPVPITSVQDRDGAELPIPDPGCEQVIEPQIAAAQTYALEQVVQSGTARGNGLAGRPAAGKTGTANEDWHSWFVGYTPQLSTAVWIGYSEGNIPMQRVTINGRYYRYVYGGVLAAPTWSRYMNAAHEGMPVIGFPAPEDRLLYGDRRAVPNVIGQSVSAARSNLEAAGFRVRVGGSISSSIRVGAVAGTSPRVGSLVAPGSTITIYPSSGAPAPAPAPEPPAEDGGGDGGDDGDAEAAPGNSGNAPGRIGG